MDNSSYKQISPQLSDDVKIFRWLEEYRIEGLDDIPPKILLKFYDKAYRNGFHDAEARYKPFQDQVTMVRNFSEHPNSEDVPSFCDDEDWKMEEAFRDGWGQAVVAINERITEMQKETS